METNLKHIKYNPTFLAHDYGKSIFADHNMCTQKYILHVDPL